MKRITLVIDIDIDDIEDDIVRPVNVGDRCVNRIRGEFPTANLVSAWRNPEDAR